MKIVKEIIMFIVGLYFADRFSFYLNTFGEPNYLASVFHTVGSLAIVSFLVTPLLDRIIKYLK